MSKTCPACGSPASGNFCSQCGAPLGQPRFCSECGNQIPQGGRFCNMCGTPVAGGSGGASKARAAKAGAGAVGSARKTGEAARTAAPAADAQAQPSSAAGRWLGVAGAVGVLAVILLVVLPDSSPRGASTAATAAPGGQTAVTAPPLGDPSAVDLSSMTPRQAADSLFNRVMRSVSAGDSAGARFFAPMAISAYDLVPEKNADLYYHVAVLQIINNEAAAARATAEQILSENPNHLFGLYAAAQAELLMGNNDAALDLYRRFLDSYEAEMAAGRSEYSDHATALPAMRQDAERILATRG